METKKINYYETHYFKKDLKNLLKKFATLESDIDVAKRDAIELFHLKNIDNKSIFPISGFCTEEIQVCKIKKFACRSLRGKGSRSGIRIIYAYYYRLSKVDFIEIYYKGKKENEDRERIKEYLRNLEIGKK
jgi:hypothetical protein